MKIGVLTGGGDCPGLNAVIRAVTLALQHQGATVLGIEQGFRGLLEGRARELHPADVAGILAEGGTILGPDNRCDPFAIRPPGGGTPEDQSAQALAHASRWGLDALVAIGGDGSMAIAHRFHGAGLPVVGVPKTIDNDLAHTDRTFGFDSAVAVVAEALDRLATTARSHRRVMLCETMGRYAGWIALEGGLAGAADAILLPERPYDTAAVAAFCAAREARGLSTLICIAEGAHAAGEGLSVRATLPDSPDPLRLGGAAERLQHALQPQLASEVRSAVLGHTQRGGTPTAFDRVLATRFGVHAAQLLLRGETGRMVTLAADACASVPLAAVAGHNRCVPADHPLLAAAEALGLFTGAAPSGTPGAAGAAAHAALPIASVAPATASR
jgi:ATP-dependent phosphofructokinase / diphosphate-dependent phosphofructokinase